MSGLRSNNLAPADVVDEFLVNIVSGGVASTRRAGAADVAAQLVASSGLSAAGGNLIIRYTKSALLAAVTDATAGWVIEDTDDDNNGIYIKNGAAWEWALPLPFSVVHMTAGGSGNAIVCTTTMPWPARPGAAMGVFFATAANTDGVTLAIGTRAAKSLLTATGLALTPGYLKPGLPVAFVDTGAAYRVFIDLDSAANLQAAEIAKAAAQTAKAVSEGARDVAVGAKTASEAARDIAVASRNSAVSAAEASGAKVMYDTYAAASSALSGLAANQVVEVFNDETRGGVRALYRKESGVLVFKTIAGIDPTDKYSPQFATAAMTRIADSLELLASPHIFGAVGDGNSHAVSEWLSGGARDRGFSNLAAIQAVYPYVAALTDEIDWVAITACLAAYNQCTLRANRTYIIHKPTAVINDRQVLNVAEAATLKRNAANFTRSEIVTVSPASGTYVSRFAVIGKGVIDCALDTTTGTGIAYGVNVVAGRFAVISEVTIIGAKTKPLYIGSSVTVTSFEVNIYNVRPILHEVQSGTPYQNEAGSIGLHMANCSDSVITNTNPVGYRTGCKHDGGSIFWIGCHPWTRYGFTGPMNKAFHFAGSGYVSIGCYADTPNDGANDVFGFYVDNKLGAIIAPKVFNYPDATRGGTDNKLIGIYFNQGNSQTIVRAAKMNASDNTAFKFKAYVAGVNDNYLDGCDIDPIQADGMVYDWTSTRARPARREGKNTKYLYDDFLGVSLDARWATLFGSSPGTIAINEQAGGCLRLTPGNNAAGTVAANLAQVAGGLSWVPASGKIKATFGVKISSATNLALVIGFSDHRATVDIPATIAGATVTPVAGNGAFWIYDTGQTAGTPLWQATSVKTAAVGALFTSALANSTSTLRILEIEISTIGDLVFRANGIVVGTASAAVDPTVALCFLASGYAKGNFVRNVDIDFISIEQVP